MDDVEVFNFDDLINDPVDETPEEQNVPQPVGNLEEEEAPETPETPEKEEEEAPEVENATHAFLKSMGVADPKKLQFTNEDGDVEEVDFDTLTPEEQLDILSQVSDPGLSDEEKDTINFLRKYNTNMNDLMQNYAEKYLEDYLSKNPDKKPQKTYKIDDYTDDDLYLVDLKSRYPDFTDEELLSKLESAKDNEELFSKETSALRKAYKDQEDQQEAERVRLEEQQAQDLRNDLISAARDFTEVSLDYTDPESDSLVIEDKDKPQMLSYILDQDSNGDSQLVKDLRDPNTLIQLAWFRTQGKEVFSNITKYWKDLLASERAENKKLRAKIEKIDKKPNTTVIKPKVEEPKREGNIYSAWDNTDLI